MGEIQDGVNKKLREIRIKYFRWRTGLDVQKAVAPTIGIKDMPVVGLSELTEEMIVDRWTENIKKLYGDFLESVEVKAKRVDDGWEVDTQIKLTAEAADMMGKMREITL